MKIDKPEHRWQLNFQRDWPTSVAFLGDGRRVAAGNRRGEILIWELPDKPPVEGKEEKEQKDAPPAPDFTPVRMLAGHTNAITHLATIDGGKTLVSASMDGTIRLWDPAAAASGKTELVLDAELRERKAKYAPKEKKEAILNAPPVVVETVAPQHTLSEHQGWVYALGISPSGRLVTGDDRAHSIVWDLKTKKIVSRWDGYDRVWVRSAAISPDGKTVFTCEFADRRSSFDAPAAQVRLWNADDGSLKLDLLKTWTPDVKDDRRTDSYGYMQAWKKLLKRGLVCAAFSPDGKLIAAGQGGETDTGQVHLIDAESGAIVRTVSGHRYGCCDVAFSEDGRYVLSTGRDTMVRICQVSDGKEIATLGKTRGGQFKDWLHAVAIAPDQRTVAAADIAGMVQVWSLHA